MKRFLIVLAVFAVACGPRVSDKDKPGDDSSNNASNNTENNANNTSPNNTTPNNTDPNNTNPNNTNPNNTNPNNTNPNNTNPNNTNPNNTNPNNTNPNNTNPNNTNPNNNNNTIPPAVVQKCATACELLWGNCVDTRCSLSADVQSIVDDVEAGCKGTGGDAGELCTTRYQNEPNYASLVDQIVAGNSCNTDLMNEHLCFTFGTDVCTGCPEPTLGGPCTNDSQCDATAGLLAGYCIAQDTDGSYPGGQCLAGGCQFDPNTNEPGSFVGGGGTGCGDDGVCYVIDASSAVCFPTCESNSDCARGVTGPNQSGYSCSILGEFTNGDVLGVCQSACSDAVPCDSQFVCGDTQACETPCTSNIDCPQGFNCSGVNVNSEMYCEYAG